MRALAADSLATSLPSCALTASLSAVIAARNSDFNAPFSAAPLAPRLQTTTENQTSGTHDTTHRNGLLELRSDVLADEGTELCASTRPCATEGTQHKNTGKQTWDSAEERRDFGDGPESAHGLEEGHRARHLGLVVRVLVVLRLRLVQLRRQLLVRMRLYRQRGGNRQHLEQVLAHVNSQQKHAKATHGQLAFDVTFKKHGFAVGQQHRRRPAWVSALCNEFAKLKRN